MKHLILTLEQEEELNLADGEEILIQSLTGSAIFFCESTIKEKQFYFYFPISSAVSAERGKTVHQMLEANEALCHPPTTSERPSLMFSGSIVSSR